MAHHMVDATFSRHALQQAFSPCLNHIHTALWLFALSSTGMVAMIQVNGGGMARGPRCLHAGTGRLRILGKEAGARDRGARANQIRLQKTGSKWAEVAHRGRAVALGVGAPVCASTAAAHGAYLHVVLKQ